MKTISKMIALASAIAVTTIGGIERAIADDISVAVKPGTTQQHLQLNHTHLDNDLDKAVVSYTSKIFLGATNGVWAYATARGVMKETPEGEKKGVGDATIAAGPMLKYGNLDELASVAVTLPTGEKGFSNDRTDIEIASRTTYRTSNGYQANLTLKRIFTGENDNGVNPPDATYVGLLVGKKLSKNFFFDAGPIIDMSDDGTYVVSAKGMSRLFLSKYCFIEFGGTQSVKSHKGSESEKMAIPETGIEFQLRYSK